VKLKEFDKEEVIEFFRSLNRKIESLTCFVKECCEKIPINVGSGAKIYKRFFNNKWEFKSLVGGNYINVTELENEIVISNTMPQLSCDDIENCIGITPSGDANKYLNEQGDFLTITIPPSFIQSISDTSSIDLTVTGTTLTADFINNAGYTTLSSFSSGTGISYNNLTGLIANSAPDQLVSLTQGGTTTITGTYPNFTINSADQYTGTVTNVTATLPLSSTSGNTPNISLTKADITTDGYLSSIDWNTFNFKEPAITAGTISQYWRGDKTWQTFPTIPTVGTWGALNYPAWTTGTPFVKMTAAGTFTLDTNTYLTSAVTSVGLTMPSAFTVANSPITSSGDIAVTGAGLVSQYVRGDGSLANFPASTGGGASQSFYLNGSVSQGTFGGVAFKEMDRVPILGAGTDFTINTNGYIQSFITDANVPNLLEIPAGNWNFETYFSASSGGGSPSFYLELYKWNGSTLSLIASNSANPEGITNGTVTDLYVSALAVPQTALLATDRLAVRIYVNNSGRTITLHTENNHLSQVITTFSTGLTALNGLTDQVQNFAVGTSGTDFAINSATGTHTFNLPTASATNRGALSSADWTAFNGKQDTLVSGTNIRTVNGNTLLGSTDLVINTPPSGLTGQIQFNNGGAFGADSNLFWDNTNKRLGIGATPATTVRLDVRAQGALSTDIPFRVRNSADTQNIVSFHGDGRFLIGQNAANTCTGGVPQYAIAIGNSASVSGASETYGSPIAIGYNSSAVSYNGLSIGNGSSGSGIAIGAGSASKDYESVVIGGTNTGGGFRTVTIGFSASNTGYQGSAIGYDVNNTGDGAFVLGTFLTSSLTQAFVYGNTNVKYIVNNNSNMIIAKDIPITEANKATYFDTSATNTITLRNGTAPVSNIADSFQQYSADRGGVAGKASAHFRAEDGTINVLGDLSGIGTSTPGARLDVRAQGALSTDIAFRVRNSADNANLMQVAGNNSMTFLSTAGSIDFSSSDAGGNIKIKRNFSSQTMVEIGGGDYAFVRVTPINVPSYIGFGSLTDNHSMFWDGALFHFQSKSTFHNVFDVACSTGSATATFRIGTIASNTNFFNVHGRNAGGTGLTTNPVFTVNSAGNFGNGAISFGTNAQFVFAQLNGVAPTTSPTDIYQQYSADIVAGNAAPHFRTENGNVIKIYRETTAVVAGAFVANTSAIVDDSATYGGYTMGQVVAALKAQGLLA
jgi:hypothetical protein